MNLRSPYRVKADRTHDENERAKSIADRGKASEASVHRKLETFDNYGPVLWERIPDYRAGSMKTALADFRVLEHGVTTFIEVKEVSKGFRLPYGNVSQLGALRRASLAGAKALVLVHCLEPELWYGLSVEAMQEIKRTSTEASWNLKGRPSGDLSVWLNTYPAHNGVFTSLALYAMQAKT